MRGGGYVSGPTVPPGFPQVPANHVLHGTAVEDKSEREKKKKLEQSETFQFFHNQVLLSPSPVRRSRTSSRSR